MSTEFLKYGGPAFPVDTNMGEGGFGHQTSGSTWQFPGMSLRDYFAGKAMQSLIAGESAGEWDDANAARSSYRIADAMLKARSIA